MGSLGLISHPISGGDVDSFRQKEIEEKELRNFRYRSKADSRVSIGASGDGPTRCAYARSSGREPGELSDDSGSDEDFESERRTRKRVIDVSDDGNKRFKVDHEKREFSSVVWSRDCEKGKFSSVSGRISQTRHVTGPLPGKPAVAAAMFSHVSTASVSSRSASPLSTVEDELDEVCMDNSLGAAVLDEDVSMPSISACRWANDMESPVHEEENCYSDTPKLKRKKPDISRFGEKGSEKDMGSSSDERTRPSSCCTDQDKDDMDISFVHNQYGPISSNLETDSDDDCSHSMSPPRTLNMLQGCRSVNEFEILRRINEGTYGVVYKARDRKTGEIVALKKLKMKNEREGFPVTALREINILLAFHHPSVVGIKEVVVGDDPDSDSIFMSMEYMDHDLKKLIKTMKQPFSQSEVKCLMLQLLEGVKYLHDNWVLHRDLKSENLLLNSNGELKICDFGLARQYGSPLKPYTALVVTLWYRAPELLLGAKEYSTAIDMWSVGCIMAELLSKKPLFDGKAEVDQLDKIFTLLGTPNENIWPGFSKLPGAKAKFVNHRYNRLRQKFPATSFTGSPVLTDSGFCLLNSLLAYDPKQRITAEDALKHEWFQEAPLPREKEFMPTYQRCMQ